MMESREIDSDNTNSPFEEDYIHEPQSEEAAASNREDATSPRADDSSRKIPRNYRLDLVDFEAEDDNDESDNSQSDNDDREFSQFLKLPPEIRHLVWTFFCPELAYKAAVLSYSRAQDWIENDVSSMMLDIPSFKQALSRKVVGAVHRESRQIILKRFPDTMLVRAQGEDGIFEVRVNQHSDVVYFRLPFPDLYYGLRIVWPQESKKKIQNLCFDLEDAIRDEIEASSAPEIVDFVHHTFPSVRNLFLALKRPKIASLSWTIQKEANNHLVSFYEDGEAGIPNLVRYMWCWPKLTQYPTWAKYEVWRTPSLSLIYSALEQKGVEVSSLVELTDSKIDRWRDTFLTDRLSLPRSRSWSSSSSQEDGSDGADGHSELENAYESDGIDDAEVLDVFDSSEEEAGLTSDEDAYAGEDHTSGLVIRRKRRVIDSDESDDDVAVSQAKRARIGSTILIDADENKAPSRIPRRRFMSRIVESDEDDEDGEGEDEDDAEEDEGGDHDSSDGEVSLTEEDEGDDDEDHELDQEAMFDMGADETDDDNADGSEDEEYY